MKNLYAILVFVLLVNVDVFGQAKKPTIMVIPANVWCTENGYMLTYNDQGTIKKIPDYKKALDSDLNLLNVITNLDINRDLYASVIRKSQDHPYLYGVRGLGERASK